LANIGDRRPSQWADAVSGSPQQGSENMLVLSRKLGERLFIADHEIIVTVLAIKGDRVRLGITAPDHIGIHREEVWCRKQDLATADAQGD